MATRNIGFALLLMTTACATKPQAITPEPLPATEVPSPEANELMLPTTPVPCPNLNARYAHKTDAGEIKSGVFKSSPDLISFPESENLIPDGKLHPLPGKPEFSYVAQCFASYIDIKLSRTGRKPYRFIRYSLTEKSIRDQTITFTVTPSRNTEINVEETIWDRQP